MMNCREATRLLSDARERRLSARERTALRLHVMMCSACRRFGKQMAVLGELARAYAKGNDKAERDMFSPD